MIREEIVKAHAEAISKALEQAGDSTCVLDVQSFFSLKPDVVEEPAAAPVDVKACNVRDPLDLIPREIPKPSPNPFTGMVRLPVHF